MHRGLYISKSSPTNTYYPQHLPKENQVEALGPQYICGDSQQNKMATYEKQAARPCSSIQKPQSLCIHDAVPD